MRKHATASVFLLSNHHGDWHIGLIHHPRLHRWMLPGGHVEPDENPAEAALREVQEETGLNARLVTTEPRRWDDVLGTVPLPAGIAEQHVPPETRLPEPHIHVDHLYLAVADPTQTAEPELPFAWYAVNDLDNLDMFPETRTAAQRILTDIDAIGLAAGAMTAAGA
ncbi:NUDIX hydrolase [Hamadaea tsunoensis]|uniref:NUDIX hydrolase n=1 Tax=Hamadaea tsunoensis TaxID=53368 RepID=UPI0004233CEE|nr:NUDIX domain-containing protein [Hamadaea tsunoensis]